MNVVEKVSLLYRHWHYDVIEEDVDLSNWACGTQACLAGHACAIFEFNVLGLHAHNSRGDARGLPAFGGEIGYDALYAFFDRAGGVLDLFRSRNHGQIDRDLRAQASGDEFDSWSDYELAARRMEHWLTERGVDPKRALL